MEWAERFNRAMDYIEENIRKGVDEAQLGKITCCSSYHFQRMFSYLAGMPLSEYIRKRKMSLAAADLRSGEEKIIDIAWKYGYRSPTAFNRAFQAVQGSAPSAVRDGTAPVKSFPPISFQVVVKGVEAMQYRIETREAFQIAGVSAPLHRELEENFAVFATMSSDEFKNKQKDPFPTKEKGIIKNIIHLSPNITYLDKVKALPVRRRAALLLCCNL